MLLLTGHGVQRLSQRTKLTIEELRVILDTHAYVNLGCAGMQETDYILFYDGRLREYMVGCVREDTLVTIMPQHFDVPSVIRKELTDKNCLIAKNLFYDVAAPKFLVSCPTTLDVLITVRNNSKYVIDGHRMCCVDRLGYMEVSAGEMFEWCASEILHLFCTKNEKGVLAYNTILEVLLCDTDGNVVSRFETTVKKFLNHNITDDEVLQAELSVSYVNDVAVLPFGVIPYVVVREKNRIWHHLADSLEKVVEKCEIMIPHHILSGLRYRLQFKYKGFMLSDWQSLSTHSIVCRMLDYHPR